MSTQNRVSCCSLQNQTVGLKAWVRTTEYYPIQQSPGNRSTVIFAAGAFRNSTLRPDQEKHASERSSSSYKRNPRSATFIQVGPPRRRPSQVGQGCRPETPRADRSPKTPHTPGQRRSPTAISPPPATDTAEKARRRGPRVTHPARPNLPPPAWYVAVGAHHHSSSRSAPRLDPAPIRCLGPEGAARMPPWREQQGGRFPARHYERE
jgi:hypothetical protein